MNSTYVFRFRGSVDLERAAVRTDERMTRMLKYHPVILEASAAVVGTTVTMTIRATGQDRTRMIVAVRKFATAAVTGSGLEWSRPLVPESVTTEPNGRSLLMGEGRTPRGPYRPRASRRTPGNAG